MAVPQSKEDMQNAVDAIASKQMGVPPQAGGATAPQQAPQQQAETKETNQEKAASTGSPNTEGDKVAAEAVVYEIDFGEKDKDGNSVMKTLTDKQIKGTFERYSAMNHQNAQYKPVMDLVRQIQQANPELRDPAKFADQMKNIYMAQVKNPTMGNTEGERSQGPTDSKMTQPLNDQLSKWEEDNAVQLPPGYKEMLVNGGGEMKAIKQQLAQTQNALRAMMARTQGVADAARDQVQNATQDKTMAIKQSIANNLDQAQAALRLPDDKGNDFMIFAAERGFTLEDFADQTLTMRVMQDYANNMNSPEMERIRNIAMNRQAYTGSLGSSPGGGSSAAPAEEMSTFDKMANAAMSKRGMA